MAELTDFGIAVLKDRYYWHDEQTPTDLFSRVSTAYGSNPGHRDRILSYMERLWFMPATPILSNGGTNRGLPISCFLNTVEDNMAGITGTWNENVGLASGGGGIGTYWGGVRSVGEPVKHSGQTSGIIPFIKVMDSLTLAISQGSLRRGSAAVYLDVWHPEIEEFLEIRKPSGDFNRKSLNLHHGVNLDDTFMEAVKTGQKYDLKSPKTGKRIKSIDARTIWQRILELRLETGEPYLNWTDTVNRSLPQSQKDLGLRVVQSNLCSEIQLPTNSERTAVCCLSSLNLATYDEWRDQQSQIVRDVLEFLDNVLTDFISRTNAPKAKFSAERERAVGLGVMGLHTYFQKNSIPFDSVMAKVYNTKIFRSLRQDADAASQQLAVERGSCPDVPGERFSHKLAVAPTANISIICGGVSAGIEPIPSNVYTHKTLSGSFVVKNAELEKLIGTDEELWEDISKHDGSIQHLDIDQGIKDVFKTAFEIDQRWIIELAADRAPFICQGQSTNLFLDSTLHKKDLHGIHFQAWEKGLKSLYYVRSKSVQRGTSNFNVPPPIEPIAYDECLSCE